jgi:hypothetical protein|tara:strand:+ start:1695 stop:2660 length:966 start_codon:yes stop_codon:yes gene_type:complete
MSDPIVPRHHYIALKVGATNAYDDSSVYPITVTSSNISDFDGYGIFVNFGSNNLIIGNTNSKVFNREEAIKWYYKAEGYRWQGTNYNFPVQGFDNRKHENVETQFVTSDSSIFYNLSYQHNAPVNSEHFAGVSPAFSYCPNISGNKKYCFAFYFQGRTDWGQRAQTGSLYYDIGDVIFSEARAPIALTSDDYNQSTASATVTSGEYTANFTLTLADAGYSTYTRRSILTTNPNWFGTGDFYIPAYGNFGGSYQTLEDYETARDNFIADNDAVGAITNDSPIIIPGMERLVRSFQGVSYYQYYHPLGDWAGASSNAPEHKLR